LAIIIGTLVACLTGTVYAADSKCGANTGKAATGEPIVIGGIVSVTGPDNFSSSGLAAAA
jgi:branched-chain amino acid transport system substrate-binding protein